MGKRYRRGSGQSGELGAVFAQLVTCSCGRQFTAEELRAGFAVCPECGNMSMWGGDLAGLQGVLQNGKRGPAFGRPTNCKGS